MWKLFATVLAVAENGSIATSAFVTDFPTEQSCQQIVGELFKSSENVVNGQKITFKTNAVCRRVMPDPRSSQADQRQIQVPPFFGMMFR